MSSKIPGTHSVTVAEGKKIPLMMILRNKNCLHCGIKIKKDTKSIAVGAPHHCLIHFDCWQYFDYSIAYKHERPISQSPGF